jgi:hypothetical protein
MAKVQAMCQALTTELEGLLYELLFRQSVTPVLLPFYKAARPGTDWAGGH